jgi:hypothetical protein
VLRRAAPAIPLALAAALPTAATAQSVVRFDPPRAEIGTRFDGSWVGMPVLGTGTYRGFEEWVALRLSGYAWHPGVFGFSATVQPTRRQVRQGGAFEPGSGGGTRFNIDVGTRLLGASPVSLTTRLLRFTSSDRPVLSTERNLDVMNATAQLRYRNPYLPVRLEVSRRGVRERWRPVDRDALIQDYTTRGVLVGAQNTKLSLVGERLRTDDRVTDRSSRIDRADGRHRFAWGKGSWISSSAQYFRRTGVAEQRRTVWQEHVHIQHLRSLASDLQFGYSNTRNGRDASTVTQRYGRGMLSYQIVPELLLIADGRAEWTQFDAGSRTVYRARPRLDASMRLPLNGYFSASAVVGYEWHRQQPSVAGSVPVVNERHVVDAAGRFTLLEAFADPSTVVVTTTDETLVFDRDFDYGIVEAGELVEIVILPTGRIQAGDTVLVDYRFELLPGERANAFVSELGARVSLAGVTAFVQHSFRGSPGDARIESLILELEQLNTGLAVVERFGRAQMNLRGAYRKRQLDGIRYDSYDARGTFTVVPARPLRFSLGGSASTGRGSGDRVNIYSGDAGLQWVPSGLFRARLRGTWWRWTQGTRRTSLFGAGAEVDWRVGLLEVRASYDRSSWREGLPRVEHRMTAYIVRRF